MLHLSLEDHVRLLFADVAIDRITAKTARSLTGSAVARSEYRGVLRACDDLEMLYYSVLAPDSGAVILTLDDLYQLRRQLHELATMHQTNAHGLARQGGSVYHEIMAISAMFLRHANRLTERHITIIETELAHEPASSPDAR